MTNLIVAAALILEAGGEGKPGMRAVREVIATRAVQSRSCESSVVTKRLQFSAFNGISTNAAIAKASRHPKWNLALEMSAQPARTSHAKGANHYCTLDTFPKWAKGRTPVAVVKNHKFFKL